VLVERDWMIVATITLPPRFMRRPLSEAVCFALGSLSVCVFGVGALPGAKGCCCAVAAFSKADHTMAHTAVTTSLCDRRIKNLPHLQLPRGSLDPRSRTPRGNLNHTALAAV
jgi:hypothetical protein